MDLKAPIYAKDFRDWTALHYASYNGRDHVVRLLCKYDDDANKLRHMRNTQGRTAKEIAAKEQTKKYFDTLWESSRTGKLDVVRRLVISGEHIDAGTIKNSYTPLILASQGQHLLVVKYLLDHGANPHLRDKEGKSALDYAHDTNNIKVVALIQEAIDRENGAEQDKGAKEELVDPMKDSRVAV